jgi:hypothetical protein
MDEQPLFTVTVKGFRRDDGSWVIEATNVFRAGLTEAERQALRGEVQEALLKGIVHQGLKGRRAGTLIAEVVLDEGWGPRVVRPSEMGLS